MRHALRRRKRQPKPVPRDAVRLDGDVPRRSKKQARLVVEGRLEVLEARRVNNNLHVLPRRRRWGIEECAAIGVVRTHSTGVQPQHRRLQNRRQLKSSHVEVPRGADNEQRGADGRSDDEEPAVLHAERRSLEHRCLVKMYHARHVHRHVVEADCRCRRDGRVLAHDDGGSKELAVVEPKRCAAES